jgi:hypothetical protein
LQCKIGFFACEKVRKISTFFFSPYTHFFNNFLDLVYLSGNQKWIAKCYNKKSSNWIVVQPIIVLKLEFFANCMNFFLLFSSHKKQKKKKNSLSFSYQRNIFFFLCLIFTLRRYKYNGKKNDVQFETNSLNHCKFMRNISAHKFIVIGTHNIMKP